MKVTLDISKLLVEGKITQTDFDKLTLLSSQETTLLAVNIMIAFGILAVMGGVIALSPPLLDGIALGLFAKLAGLWLLYNHQKRWGVLGNALFVIGSLSVANGLIQYYENNLLVFVFIAIFFIITGCIAKSALLMIFSALSMAPLVQTKLFQWQASEFVYTGDPIPKILVYGILSFSACFLSSKLSPKFERLAIIFSRTSFIMMNFGFLVGSYWGDGHSSQSVLAFLWAVVLITTGYWATQKSDWFTLNTVAAFGAVLLYTQWLEVFLAYPFATISAGIIIVILIASWQANKNEHLSSF